MLLRNFTVFFALLGLAACQSTKKATVALAEPNAVIEMAKGGDTSAQHRLCYDYSYGARDLPEDAGKAVFWCTKGAEAGVLSSVTLLAEKHLYGLGVPENKSLAYTLYAQAANAGHRHAQYIAARILLEGEAVEPDLDQAIIWLEASASQGYAPARELLEFLANEPEYRT
ncbi:tetratricopeptide repeat protein [uncultured Abyssibacter sp.]|uniref:tetratricopeptide repeat protein n=1 Tax=uncultured Abyssibacter sp. TaxID=2320202 RepID=UPI0032B2282A